MIKYRSIFASVRHLISLFLLLFFEPPGDSWRASLG